MHRKPHARRAFWNDAAFVGLAGGGFEMPLAEQVRENDNYSDQNYDAS